VEAKYASALDKIEALIYLIYSGGKYFDEGDHIATHTDKAIEKCPELKDLFKLLKGKLKQELKRAIFEWKKECNN